MTSTAQPVWKLVAQLGDVNPIDYGGLFVYVDTTGVYPPEAEKLMEPIEDNGVTKWEVYRFILENLKAVEHEGRTLLIPARYDPSWPHPIERYDEWFNSDLESVSSYVGQVVNELRQSLVADDPAKRALAWQAIGDYHGWDNLDSYPLTYTSEAEIRERYEKRGGLTPVS